MTIAIRDLLVPAIKDLRDEIVQDGLEDRPAAAAGGEAAQPAQDQPPQPRIILTFDGEQAHLNAAMTSSWTTLPTRLRTRALSF